MIDDSKFRLTGALAVLTFTHSFAPAFQVHERQYQVSHNFDELFAGREFVAISQCVHSWVF